MHIGKEEVKVSFFILDTIAYMSDHKNFIREFFHQLNTFSKVARYKIRKKIIILPIYQLKSN